MFISEKRTLQGIANELNRQGVPFQDNREWKDHAVRRILCNPKYKGTAIYNRTTSKLMAVQKPTPVSEWIVVPEAFAPIVDVQTFEAAQQVFRNKPWNLSNEQVLEALRTVLKTRGMLSSGLIKNAPRSLSTDGYRRRFGSLTKAFQLVGYDSPREKTVQSRHEIQRMRRALMQRLVQMFPNEVSILARGPIRRDCLKLRNGTRVAVRACRSRNLAIKGQAWIMQPAGPEKRLVALMAGMNLENTALEVFYVLPPGIANRCKINISLGSKWLKRGVRLPDLSSFCEAVHSIVRQRKLDIGSRRRRPKGWLSEEARASIAASQRIRWAMWRSGKK